MKVWAYIHPQLNILCCALLPEAVPQGIQAIEFDVESPNDIVYDGSQIRLKTQDEKLQELKSQKLSELRMYVAGLLSQTDWVVIKLQSMINEGLTDAEIQAEKQKYQPILDRRKAIRIWNAQMEQAIQNAQTIEELEAIKIEFEGYSFKNLEFKVESFWEL
jgi:hypothetical protein